MIHQKETILIVDDSRLQRAVLNEIFSEQYNVIEATTVEECLKIIENKINRSIWCSLILSCPEWMALMY